MAKICCNKRSDAKASAGVLAESKMRAGLLGGFGVCRGGLTLLC